MRPRGTPQGPSAEAIRAELEKLGSKTDHYTRQERKRLTAALERLGETPPGPPHNLTDRAPDVASLDSTGLSSDGLPNVHLTPGEEQALREAPPSFPATAAADREIATLRQQLATMDQGFTVLKAERDALAARADELANEAAALKRDRADELLNRKAGEARELLAMPRPKDQHLEIYIGPPRGARIATLERAIEYAGARLEGRRPSIYQQDNGGHNTKALDEVLERLKRVLAGGAS